jgi:chemotaxis protein CheX
LVLSKAELTEISKETWSSMLQIEAEPSEGSIHWGGNLSVVRACVQIVGPFSMAVILECTQDSARAFASIMFGMDKAEVGLQETCDAVGELANIVAGNIKSLAPAPSQLSLPTVGEGDGFTLVVTHSRILERVAFQTESGPFVLSVFCRQESNLAKHE